jgi:GT2 family glycosyltransferase
MNPASNPFLSVVIPTFERPDDLKKCLESLSYQNQIGAPSFEIIVSDDSESSDSIILVEKEFPKVVFGKGKKNGPAGNRNAGVRRAKGVWIIFIDDDCIADKNFLNAYSKAIKDNPKAILFEGKIYPDRPRKTWAECCPENSHGDMFWTSNLCVKKDVFNKVGGFDERFKVAYEDIDFAYRVNSLGLQSKFVKEASVCHPWRTLKHEGNNWKPKGFEVSELLKFIDKHPKSYEHSSIQKYCRHLLRMLTTDLKRCLIEFKGAGIMVLISQSLTTFTVIMALTYNKFKSN